MSTTTLRKQFITDAHGNSIGVILPIEDYKRIEGLLRQRDQHVEDKLQLLEKAANDPLFVTDLNETMREFQQVDAEWWERKS